MTARTRNCLLALAGVVLTIAAGARALADHTEDQTPIGLSLLFQNGAMAPVTLIGDAPRYLQEIDIVATASPSKTDQGIAPLMTNGEFSSLDWSGVKMVEEDWRAPGDGTFTRQRFYRGAKWMIQESHFQLIPIDGNGTLLGNPILASAGSDDRWKHEDDGFVRRFVVRQIAAGCRAVGDCATATFTAQALVQFRDALHAEKKARPIPPHATALKLEWSENKSNSHVVHVNHSARSSFPFGYGFSASIEPASPPSNGHFFLAGDKVTFRVTFRDGQGNRLHPLGSLPTYGQFVRGEISSGLRYFDGFRLSPTLYYALKHREANTSATLSGPVDKLRLSSRVIPGADFFAPQTVTATVPQDGYSASAVPIPPGAVILGGLSNPSVWDTPVSDLITFAIPSDALPGTYVAAVKGRRDFAGEALNRGATTTIQVGTSTPTSAHLQTGPCNTCHSGASALANILHGIGDRRACFACHSALESEPDGALDIRVHEVHDRSNRFPADIRNCSLCHLTPPSGPARGLLPH